MNTDDADRADVRRFYPLLSVKSALSAFHLLRPNCYWTRMTRIGRMYADFLLGQSALSDLILNTDDTDGGGCTQIVSALIR